MVCLVGCGLTTVSFVDCVIYKMVFPLLFGFVLLFWVYGAPAYFVVFSAGLVFCCFGVDAY